MDINVTNKQTLHKDNNCDTFVVIVNNISEQLVECACC
jgi:hypothetical protein